MNVKTNFRYFVGLWFCLSSVVDAATAEFAELHQLLHPIQSAKQRIESASVTIPSDGMTVLLGVTGSGKTTIFNLLLDIPLCAKKGKTIGNPVVIDLLHEKPAEEIPGELRYEIREGPIPGTALPDFAGKYCDLPGFDDSRVLEGVTQNPDSLLIQEIVNAYSINKVFNQIRPVKILAVINYTHLTQRMEQFFSFLQHIGTIFKGNSTELSKNFGLVVTRLPQYHKEDEEGAKDLLENTFKEFDKEEKRKHYTAEQRFALGKLKELKKDRVTFLYEPPFVQDASRRVHLDLSREKAAIESLIKRATDKINPRFSLSLNAQNRLDRACTIFNQAVSQTIEAVYSKMPDYLNAHIINANNIHNLRQSFQTMATLIGDLPNTRQNYLQNFDNVHQFFQAINAQAAATTFGGIRPFLDFFEETRFPDTINPNIWGRIPAKFISLLRQFAAVPSIPTYTDGMEVLSMKGLLIATSEIIAELGRHNYSRVNVFALHSLFLDQSIEKPGADVGLWAFNWISRTQGGKTINLSGENGANHSTQAQNEQHGNPGHLGKNGGHFYGKLKHFYGTSRLTVNVSGGRGGNGQGGGKGNNGEQGEPGTSQAVLNKTSVLYERVKVDRNIFTAAASFFFTPLNVKYKETYISGKKGRPGGNGGKGGKGGHGGHGGFIQINDGGHPRTFELITEINQEGNRGENGTSGRGGKGGKHGGENGSMYRAVYTAEYVTPELRGIGIIEADDDKITVEKRAIPVVLGIGAHGLPVVAGAILHAAPSMGRWLVGKSGATVLTRLGVGAGIGSVFSYLTGGLAVGATIISPIISNRKIEGPTVIDGVADDGLTPPADDLNEHNIRTPQKRKRANFADYNQEYDDYYTEKVDGNDLFSLYVRKI